MILAGSVKVHAIRPDGTEVVLAVLGAGEVLGEMSAADSLGRSASVVTLDRQRRAREHPGRRRPRPPGPLDFRGVGYLTPSLSST
jgi:hypothetical protein